MVKSTPEPTLYGYVWQHSYWEQLGILALVFLSQPFYFASLSLPKDIVNHPIQGRGFADRGEGATMPFLNIAIDIPAPFDALLGARLTLSDGFALERMDYLVALSLLFLTLVCVNGLFKMRINTLKGRMGERLLRRLRFELVDRALRFPPRHLRKVRPAEVASMVKDEIEPLGGFTGDAIVLPAMMGLQALTALFFILYQNWALGLIALGVVLIQIPIIRYLRRPLLRLGKQRQLQARDLAGRVGEIVDGAADIHVHDTSNYERADVASRLGRIFETRFEIYQRKFQVKFLNNLLAQMTPFIFYLWGGYLVITGGLDVGQLVAVLIAYKDLPSPIKELLDWDQIRQDVTIKYDQVMEQFHPDGMLDSKLQAPLGAVPPLTGPVVLQGVSAADDAGFTVLEPTSLSFTLTESIAVKGPVGGGKEGLAQAFARQLSLSGGPFRIAGAELDALPEAITGRRIAYVGPESYVFARSLKDNILYGLKNEARQTKAAPLDPRSMRRTLRDRTEAERSGNTVMDLDADWIDYAAAGASPQTLDRRLAGVLHASGLEDDIIQFGLKARLDPERHSREMTLVLKARAALRSALAASGGLALVEPFDPDAYNRNATLAENILFGTSSDPAYQTHALARNAVVRRAIAAAGLESDLVAMGRAIAETMVELFRDFPPDHPFFEEYSFISAVELPAFEQILKRTKGDLATADATDRERLLSLPFRYVDARHRLGLITGEIRGRVLEARRLFEAIIRALGTRSVDVYEPEEYNAGATLADNILFGRIAYGVAGAGERVNAMIRDVLAQDGLDELVLNAGLAFEPGAQGKRLSHGQRQKLGLARALIKRPDLLVINGGLAHVDERQRGDIVARVLDMRKGKATLWVLAQDDLAQRFDRILTFEHGRLTADTRTKPESGSMPMEPALANEERSA